MPVYEYRCKDCNLNFNDYRQVEEYNSPAWCPECGKEDSVDKLLSKPQFVFSQDSELKQIEQEAHQNGNIIVEPGLDKDAKRNKEYQEEKCRKRIRESIEETFKYA